MQCLKRTLFWINAMIGWSDMLLELEIFEHEVTEQKANEQVYFTWKWHFPLEVQPKFYWHYLAICPYSFSTHLLSIYLLFEWNNPCVPCVFIWKCDVFNLTKISKKLWQEYWWQEAWTIPMLSLEHGCLWITEPRYEFTSFPWDRKGRLYIIRIFVFSGNPSWMTIWPRNPKGRWFWKKTALNGTLVSVTVRNSTRL